MIVLLSRVVLVASNTCRRQTEGDGRRSNLVTVEHGQISRNPGCLFTHSHLSLFLGEVGGDVFEGGSCTGPEGEVTLSDLQTQQIFESHFRLGL